MKAKEPHVALHHTPGHVLRVEIRWIFSARDFGQAKVAMADTVLDPQVGHMQVPYFAEAAPSAYADCGRRIGEELKVELNAEIGGQ